MLKDFCVSDIENLWLRRFATVAFIPLLSVMVVAYGLWLFLSGLAKGFAGAVRDAFKDALNIFSKGARVLIEGTRENWKAN